MTDSTQQPAASDRTITYLPARVLATMLADEDQRVLAEHAVRVKELRERFMAQEDAAGGRDE